MKYSTNLKNLAVFLGLSVFGATSALAIPLITQWGSEQEFEFTDWEDTNGGGGDDIFASGGSGSNVPGVTKLAWGDENGAQSSIVINPTGDPTVPSNVVSSSVVTTSTDGVLELADFSLGPKLVHNNFTISGDFETLDTAEATDFVNLTAIAPAFGAILPARELMFDINFAETVNSLSGTDCPAGNPGGECSDIFTISGDEFGASVDVVDSDDDAFQIDQFSLPGDEAWQSIEYTVYILAEGLEFLSDAVCGVAGADAGCIGFITEEGLTSEFQLQFAIAARKVPEPGILVLMAIGLMMIVAVRRKKLIV